MYEKGQGVDQNDKNAVEWYKKAADQSLAEAQNNLGMMYEMGKGGLTQSNAKALELYQKAADQGFAKAQKNLGTMYYNGKGIPSNLSEQERQKIAAKWYQKAAAQGSEPN